MRKDCFKRTHQFKEALLQREGWGGERKALPECRKIMFNYATHELNRTVLIKKGKTCSLTDGSIQSSLRKRGLMPSPRCWRNRRRCGAPGSSPGSSLHFPARPQLSASSAEQEVGCWPSGGNTSLTSFSLLSLPKQFLHSTSIICKPCCKSLAFIFPSFSFFCLKEKYK